MGTIADKLNYLNETKEAIKTSIINKGVEVSDTDTFRSYAEKINSIEAGGGEDFDWSQIRKTSNMFNGNTTITEAPFFDTSTVTDMTAMFSGCTNLEKVPEYDTSNVTSMGNMFKNCKKLTSVPVFDTQKVTSLNSFLYNCAALKTFPALNTSSLTNIQYMFWVCTNLETIPLLDFGKVNSMTQAFNGISNLINCGGFKDLGKGFTQKSNNYSPYALILSYSKNLTHDSLMNIFNNLYDLNLTYDVANGGTLYTQQIELGSTNLAKLTADEIAIATNKGWTVR